jgi:hypothetical protein
MVGNSKYIVVKGNKIKVYKNRVRKEVGLKGKIHSIKIVGL